MYINFSSDTKYIFSFSSLLSLEERSPYIQFLFFKKLHFFSPTTHDSTHQLLW